MTGWTVRDTSTGTTLCPPRLLQWHAETIARSLSLAWGLPGRFVAVYLTAS